MCRLFRVELLKTRQFQNLRHFFLDVGVTNYYKYWNRPQFWLFESRNNVESQEIEIFDLKITPQRVS